MGIVFVWASCGCSVGGESGGACVRDVRSAPNPLPRALRGFSILFMVQDLFSQFDIALGALGSRVVNENRLSETGRLGQPNASWNDSLKDLVFKEIAKICRDLARE